MKKEFIMIILLAVFSLSANAAAHEKSALIGSWKCVANDVPDEYRNSTIVISEKEGILTGVVKFDNGTEIALNYVKHTENDVIMSVYVEGSEVIIKGKLAGSKITGTADTPDGQVTLTATRVKKKK
ncbi:MAG: hypothetical protein A2X05_09910 [Bacteroidetes bacterium GWE2_41_25]|nr:MAG: hypothetical protein A2X03_06975 [Bacteroidetes bacterium GWA2_40_15]OFX90871.1 MAG: hypothetical protein A2X06_01070 [Bacteroidetes bacterium GWC2_40_22]OFY07604.1 MAG: hypothetical protein A2X05_09910 [Bacteroidetes bacterium GWE2_41_25]OFY56881.1 MAG: hypothetical protein A2X04_03865 [Bacteroidetes bacterium GWF2_41_9]HAM09688.1 hypothetical protein [Bacteroidales bacterium]